MAVREQKEKVIFRKRQKEDFYRAVREIAHHPAVLEMKKYPQHGRTSCYSHCLRVAYYNYRICRLLGLDARSAARAGMLHDLFLYDWHQYARRTGKHFHGLTHPAEALKNARRYFRLNPLEQEMIVKHMWPLTLFPPMRREAWIICLTDKYCSTCETMAGIKARLLG